MGFLANYLKMNVYLATKFDYLIQQWVVDCMIGDSVHETLGRGLTKDIAHKNSAKNAIFWMQTIMTVPGRSTVSAVLDCLEKGLAIEWFILHWDVLVCDLEPYSLQCPHCPFKTDRKCRLEDHLNVHIDFRKFVCLDNDCCW